MDFVLWAGLFVVCLVLSVLSFVLVVLPFS